MVLMLFLDYFELGVLKDPKTDWFTIFCTQFVESL